MKNVILFVSFLISCAAFAGSNGGATTVGDGGYVIECGDHQELFDLFEYSVNTGTRPAITLAASKNSTLKQMVATGLQRIQTKFALNEMDFARVKRAAKMLLLDSSLNRGIDQSWLNSWSFSAREIIVTRQVGDAIRQNNCSIATAIVRPPMNSFFASICSRNLSEFEFCFITDVDLFWRLHKKQRACLVVHEILRFLPPSAALSEPRLRTATAEICTQAY